MKRSAIFLDVTPCSLVELHRGFEETYSLHVQGGRVSQADHAPPPRPYPCDPVLVFHDYFRCVKWYVAPSGSRQDIPEPVSERLAVARGNTTPSASVAYMLAFFSPSFIGHKWI
jgi:hypothetical protein